MKDHFVLRNMSTNENIPLISKSVVLGRSDECGIVVESSEASRQHSRITLEGGQLTLEDLGSTNGTILNGRRLRQPEILGGGDIIAVGQVNFLVVAPGSAGHMTILGGRLGRVDENYVVDQVDPNSTGLRMPYPKPPGWSEGDDLLAAHPTKRSPLDVLPQEMARQSVGPENTAAALMIVSKQGRNTVFPLKAGKDAWTLGRASNNDVEICDVTISSLHALVTEQSGTWRINDKQSTNGTRINGKKIDVAVIEDGDILSLGKVELAFTSL